MAATTAALTGLLILATAVWIGGVAAITIVARVASRTLTPDARVTFFRGLGRSYGVVGTAALALAYGTGAAIVYGRPWDNTLTVTAVVATLLLFATTTGAAQARRMSRLRRHALDHPDDAEMRGQVRRGASRAGVLRASIGLLSLALLALGVLLGT
jgi:uncharacterized membrane protein